MLLISHLSTYIVSTTNLRNGAEPWLWCESMPGWIMIVCALYSSIWIVIVCALYSSIWIVIVCALYSSIWIVIVCALYSSIWIVIVCALYSSIWIVIVCALYSSIWIVIVCALYSSIWIVIVCALYSSIWIVIVCALYSSIWIVIVCALYSSIWIVIVCALYSSIWIVIVCALYSSIWIVIVCALYSSIWIVIVCALYSSICRSIQLTFLEPRSYRECEANAFGSVCMFVCVTFGVHSTKTITPIDFYLFTQEGVYPCLDPPVRWSGSGLQNLLKDSSPLRDRTKYDIEVRNDVNDALKTCFIRWKARHSERGSAISDCLCYSMPSAVARICFRLLAVSELMF